MSGPAFFQTRMGQVFFDVTMPRVAEELGHIAASLAEIAKARSASCQHPAGEAPGAAAPRFRSEVMATLAHIAREHLGIVRLEERKLDRLDSYDVGVKAVATALRAAYETGFAAGVAEGAH